MQDHCNFKMSKEDKSQTYVIMPAYNEESRVQPILEEIASLGFKVLIINDGSSDNTLEVIMKSQKKIFTTAIKTIAEKSLERNANSTSCIIYYQPEVPSALKKFSKIDNDK